MNQLLPPSQRSHHTNARVLEWRSLHFVLRAALFLLLFWMTCQGLQAEEKASLPLGGEQVVTAGCLHPCGLDGALSVPVDTSSSLCGLGGFCSNEADHNDPILLPHGVIALAAPVAELYAQPLVHRHGHQLSPLLKPPRFYVSV